MLFSFEYSKSKLIFLGFEYSIDAQKSELKTAQFGIELKTKLKSKLNTKLKTELKTLCSLR